MDQIRDMELFLDELELNERQKEAVLCDDDVLRVVAGAGTGKTKTLVAKVRYLIEMKGIKPEEILCLSFSRDSAKELRDRINAENIPATDELEDSKVRVATFHSFGLHLLDENTWGSNTYYNSLKAFLIEEFKKDLHWYEGFKRYFYNIFNHRRTISTYDERGVIIKYRNVKDARKDGRDSGPIETLDGRRTVFCNQDFQIANFLLLNNIEFVYEREMDIPYIDDKFLLMDFYLPEYDLYIEDYRVNDKGVPEFVKKEQRIRKYQKQFDFKKEHVKNMIVINSSHENYIEDELKSRLLENGVKLTPLSFEELEKIFSKNQFFEDVKKLVPIIENFISSFKEQGFADEEMDKYVGKNNTEKFFLSFISSFYKFYKVFLEKRNLVDYPDMIIKAIPKEKDYPYKYVLVDEYQDISENRYRLLKSIVDECNSKLVVVGDDWQSIYGFTGCNIKYFSNFENYFPNPTTIKLNRTYRSPNELVKTAGDFVDNDEMISKEVRSIKNLPNPIHLAYFEDKDKNKGFRKEDILVYRILEEISNEFTTKKVMILSRYNDHLDDLHEKLDKVKASKKLGLEIEYHTFHGAKGLESDNVIILDAYKINQGKGIPSDVRNEGIFRFVSFNSDNEKRLDEERRLFYVALTRTKNRVYLCINCHEKFKSPFVEELGDENVLERYDFKLDQNPYKDSTQTTFDDYL